MSAEQHLEKLINEREGALRECVEAQSAKAAAETRADLAAASYQRADERLRDFHALFLDAHPDAEPRHLY